MQAQQSIERSHSLGMKLDFRFADEMDSMDLEAFVNEMYKVEWSTSHSDNVLGFRTATPKVLIEEIEKDLVGMPVKWLVLETPVPEELIVAAARLQYDSTHNDGRVDILCASAGTTSAGDNTNRDANTGNALQNSLLRQIISKVETVAFTIGLRSVIMEIPQWRTDLQHVVEQCGYIELSGYIWPEHKQEQLTKPTMILEYHKLFPKPPPPPTAAITASPPIISPDFLLPEPPASSLPPVPTEWPIPGIEGAECIDGGATSSSINMDGHSSTADILSELGKLVTSTTIGTIAETATTTSASSSGTSTGTQDTVAAVGGGVDGRTVLSSAAGAGAAAGEKEEGMPELFESLFKALHAEYGTGTTSNTGTSSSTV
mmetsp:Transcript_21839/g.36543  ORF Transcript_21839/g.36543 Transcript_21839/m.36543 type:complete len:373 (-) Transcript_21839:1377-2495(-)